MASEAPSTPNHLGTDVPSGNMGHHSSTTESHSEKKDLEDVAAARPSEKKAAADEDEEDEDMDALIDELESHDGGAVGAEEEEEEGEAGSAPPVSEDLLQTSTRTGLTEHEVGQRRKKFGLNQMKEEKENLVLKFLGYFVGPIQFVMEVSFLFFARLFPPTRVGQWISRHWPEA